MPLWYVSDLDRIWFSAQALTVGLPSIRWGIGVALYGWQADQPSPNGSLRSLAP